jgi:predicted dehydrogenase
MEHANGVHARVWTTLIAGQLGPRFRIRGLAGEYVKDGLDAQEAQLTSGMRPDDPAFGEEPPDRWGEVSSGDGSTRVIPTVRGAYIRFYEMFRDAVRGEGPPPVDPVESIQGLRVLEAAERSARSGAVERV